MPAFVSNGGTITDVSSIAGFDRSTLSAGQSVAHNVFAATPVSYSVFRVCIGLATLP
jgi:hypothetical protein